MEQTSQLKSRLGYIDIAKGILMMCLVYGHLAIISKGEGMNDVVITKWIPATVPLYSSFFMPAFFILSGYCSTFKIKFKTYLWKAFKILIIPAVIVKLLAGYGCDFILGNQLSWNHFFDLSKWLTTGAPWFVLSLFWAKLIYWPITKLTHIWQLILVLMIGVMGYVLHRLDVPDYQWHQHAMMLLPWLCFGNICKSYKDIVGKWLLPIGIFGAISIFIQNILRIKLGWFIPVVDAFIRVHWRDMPLWYINVISGTAAVLCLSKWIAKNNILQTFGKGSLLIYLLDYPVRRTIIGLTGGANASWVADGVVFATAYHMSSYVVSFVLFYILIRLIYDHKSLSWIVGKF